METTNQQNIKNRLSKLTISSISDENLIMDYPYLTDFLETLNNDFPEVMLIHSRSKLHGMIISKYISTYQDYFLNNSTEMYDKASLNELFREELFKGFKSSYYEEVINIIETHFNDIYQEIEKNTKQIKKTLYATLAAGVYREIHGDAINDTIYIAPYKDGFNDQEENIIRELLSSLIISFLNEEEEVL